MMLSWSCYMKTISLSFCIKHSYMCTVMSFVSIHTWAHSKTYIGGKKMSIHIMFHQECVMYMLTIHCMKYTYPAAIVRIKWWPLFKGTKTYHNLIAYAVYKKKVWEASLRLTGEEATTPLSGLSDIRYRGHTPTSGLYRDKGNGVFIRI